MPALLVTVTDRVARLTLNRPDARNALDAELLRSLPEVIAEMDARPDVGAMVLTGADPAFCAGLDLRALSGNDGSPAGIGAAGRGPFPPHDTPIIGAINGACVTGGLELALACDFLIASPHARFADTHARVGILPGWGLSVLLPRAVGERRARHMSLTGDFVAASTALVWGLVDEIVPHDQLVSRACALAATIAALPARTVAAYRAMYDHVGDAARGEAWARESAISQAWLRDSFDRGALAAARDGIQARGRQQVHEPGSTPMP